MRTLAINKQPMWYALLESKTEVLDEYGNHTGVFDIKYSAPVYYPVNMSPSRGVAGLEQFGINANYDRTFVTTDMNCPIKEDSVIWYGKNPYDGTSGAVVGHAVAGGAVVGTRKTSPHNYVIHRVANSINGIAIAIRGVDVGKNEGER